MCEQSENAAVEQISSESNFAYVLAEKDSFLPTEYKVLQSQENGCFVRCMKLLYNGKIQLYYLTEGYRPLSELISSLSEAVFLRISSDLLFNVIQIKKNGFLSLQNVRK